MLVSRHGCIFLGILSIILVVACNEARPKTEESVSLRTEIAIDTTKVLTTTTKDTAKIKLKKYLPRYSPIDSTQIKNSLFRLSKEEDKDSKIGYFVLEYFERYNREWTKKQVWQLYGEYIGMTKRDYNGDHYTDLCVRMRILGRDTISEENKHMLLIYQPDSNAFEVLKNCWDTIGLVAGQEQGLNCCDIFGTKGEEYRLKRGSDYFCSPASCVGYVPMRWKSCLWRVEGMELKIYGHLEVLEKTLFYYPANAKHPSDSLILKKDYDLEDLDRLMKRYWIRNRRVVLSKN